MPKYGVQYYLDYEELGLAGQHETFESRDDTLARRGFYRRVVQIRRRTRMKDAPPIKGDIQFFRLNARGTEGTLLMSVPATDA